MVYCYVNFLNRTHAVRGATATHNLCTKSVVPRKGMYVRELYISLHQVHNNVICVTVLLLGCCTTMRIFGIIHLLYGVQQDTIICVHSLRQSYTDVCQTAVQIPITCARKCGMYHSVHLWVGQYHVPFLNRIPPVMEMTELHDLCIQCVEPVRQCTSGSCTDP